MSTTTRYAQPRVIREIGWALATRRPPLTEEEPMPRRRALPPDLAPPEGRVTGPSEPPAAPGPPTSLEDAPRATDDVELARARAERLRRHAPLIEALCAVLYGPAPAGAERPPRRSAPRARPARASTRR